MWYFDAKVFLCESGWKRVFIFFSVLVRCFTFGVLICVCQIVRLRSVGRLVCLRVLWNAGELANSAKCVGRQIASSHAFSADLEKMYRQIRINHQDLDFQRILWRNSPNDKIQDYQLQTITYGTACAQYLAIRSVHQLAHDGITTQPLASERMLTDFYVDDLLSGTYDLPEAIDLQRQLRELSNSGGFNLRKWASNNDAIL